ncbi:MAG TPA: bifunctional acetate--CoA ligase family protein/GNAT family N-acetyltransferase [Burkholderiaceae bacterium]
MSVRNLDALLAPRSVVVVGASDRPATVGGTVWRNVRAGGFAGAVHAVNPAHRELDGVAVFGRCSDLPEPADLAVVCVPPAAVAPTIAELAQAGTRAAIVVTAGLSPTDKAAMLEAARPHLMRVLGPNCVGLLSPHQRLNASFAHTDAPAGDLAFVTQSGALLTAVLDWAKARGVGFSSLVSLGDHADVDFGDLLDHLGSDVHTRAILLYIESIESPRKFMSAARAAARNKPVVVVKAGRAGGGVRAAASHTGALAGSDIVFDAALRRAGVLRVDTLEELFLGAETLTRLRGPIEGGLTLFTNGGGAGVVAADAAARAGIALPEPDPATLAALSACLPPTWSHGNPVDIIGDAPAQRYVDALRVLLDAPSTGTLLFMHAPTAIVDSRDIARACLPLLQPRRERVLACWVGATAVADARRQFEEAGIACLDTPEEAVRAFEMLSDYRRNQALLLEAPSAADVRPPRVDEARAIVDAAIAGGRTSLDEVDAKRLLGAYGIPIVATRRTALSAEAAVDAARAIGWPVALKILSPDLSHKSEAGGVALDLVDETAVRQAADVMLATVRERRPQARLEGFSVQAMARRPHARELIVGASLDATFGPVLMVGQGGTAVEMLGDRAIALPPLNRVLARDAIGRTRVSRLLQGWRDHPAARLDAVADALIALARMQADLPELAELDINPLWADEDGVLALDARLRLQADRPAGVARFAILPYPAELASHVEWDGRDLVLRPIRPEDEPMHAAFLDRCSPDDLRLRFFSVRRSLPRSEIARLVQIDYAREMAFVAVAPGDDGQDEILGVSRAVSDPDGVEAEFAVLVRSDLHKRGLGHLLMARIVDWATKRGTQRLFGDVLHDNEAMRILMRECGFAATPSPEHGATRFVLELAGAVAQNL